MFYLDEVWGSGDESGIIVSRLFNVRGKSCTYSDGASTAYITGASNLRNEAVPPASIRRSHHFDGVTLLIAQIDDARPG